MGNFLDLENFQVWLEIGGKTVEKFQLFGDLESFTRKLDD